MYQKLDRLSFALGYDGDGFRKPEYSWYKRVRSGVHISVGVEEVHIRTL